MEIDALEIGALEIDVREIATVMDALPMLTEFHLLRPWWLLASLPALLLAWGLLRRQAAGSSWAGVIDRELLDALLGGPQAAPSRWPIVVVLASWLLATLALAGPGFSKNDQAALKQADAVVILLDLSPSMLAEDVKPSRLQAAHYKILDLLRQRREGYTGLIAYAGSAHVVAPLSDDSNTIAALVTTLEPGIMPSIGSQAEDAVSEALQLLENSHFKRGRLLLVTDGVVPSALENIGQQLHDKDVELHVIGVGTAEGAPIALQRGGYVRDESGKIIVNTLDAAPLQQLAADNGGQYRTLRTDDGDIATLVAPPAWLAQLGNGDQRNASHTIEHWQDSGYWFALPCLALTLLLFRRGALLCLLPLLLLGNPEPVNAAEPEAGMTSGWQWPQHWQDWWQTPDQQAAAALQAGDVATAAQQFADPQWKAYAEYQNGQHQAAAEHFAAADNATAHYNRGNALAQAGDLQGAIQAYDEALLQQPDLADAKFNRDLVKKLLEQQQKNPQQNQNQNQQQQDNDQQQQQQDQQNQENQQQQGDQQQNQQQQGDQQQQQNEQQQGDQQQQQNQQQQGDSEQPAGQQGESGENRQAGDQDPQQQQQQQDAATQQAQQEQQARAQQAAEQEQTDKQPATGDAAATGQSRAEQEKQQATEQLLRKVPDDPGGLLKNKFEYYYQLNRQEDLRERRAGKDKQEEQRW